MRAHRAADKRQKTDAFNAISHLRTCAKYSKRIMVWLFRWSEQFFTKFKTRGEAAFGVAFWGSLAATRYRLRLRVGARLGLDRNL